MSRKRIIYDSQSVYVSPTWNNQDYSEDDIKQLKRIQSSSASFNINREFNSKLGSLDSNYYVDTPSVSLSLQYFVSDLHNEKSLGFLLDGYYGSFYRVEHDERDFFISVDHNDESGVYCFGNMLMNDYNISFGVGSPVSSSIGFEGFNVSYVNGKTGNIPKINPKTGKEYPNNFVIPPVDNSIRKRDSGELPENVVMKNENISVIFPSGDFIMGSLSGQGAGNVNSLNISCSFSRKSDFEMGNLFPSNRNINRPSSIRVTAEVIANQNQIDNIRKHLTKEKQDIIIKLKNRLKDIYSEWEDTESIDIDYYIKGVELESQNESLAIGSNKTLSINWVLQLGDFLSLDKNIFISGNFGKVNYYSESNIDYNSLGYAQSGEYYLESGNPMFSTIGVLNKYNDSFVEDFDVFFDDSSIFPILQSGTSYPFSWQNINIYLNNSGSFNKNKKHIDNFVGDSPIKNSGNFTYEFSKFYLSNGTGFLDELDISETIIPLGIKTQGNKKHTLDVTFEGSGSIVGYVRNNPLNIKEGKEGGFAELVVYNKEFNNNFDPVSFDAAINVSNGVLRRKYKMKFETVSGSKHFKLSKNKASKSIIYLDSYDENNFIDYPNSGDIGLSGDAGLIDFEKWQNLSPVRSYNFKDQGASGGPNFVDFTESGKLNNIQTVKINNNIVYENFVSGSVQENLSKSTAFSLCKIDSIGVNSRIFNFANNLDYSSSSASGYYFNIESSNSGDFIIKTSSSASKIPLTLNEGSFDDGEWHLYSFRYQGENSNKKLLVKRDGDILYSGLYQNSDGNKLINSQMNRIDFMSNMSGSLAEIYWSPIYMSDNEMNFMEKFYKNKWRY